MTDERLTRRRTLKLGATAGTGLVAGLAGCGSDPEDGDGTTTAGGDGDGDAVTTAAGSTTAATTESTATTAESTATTTDAETTTESASGPTSPDLSLVPAEASVVGRVDVRTLLDGPVVEQGVEKTLDLIARQQPEYSGPKTYEEVLSTAREVSGLDPRGLRTVTTFWTGSADTSTETGAVMRTDWSTAEVKGALETMGSTLSERTYRGRKLYVDGRGETTLGVLGEGRFALGTQAAVEAVVDVESGDAPPVSGAVVAAYQRSPSGPIRFGADASTLQASSRMASVETIWGGMGASGDRRKLLVAMDASDAESAGRLATLIETSIQQARTQYEDDPQFQQQLGEVYDLLGELEVSQDGSTVTVSHSLPVSEAGVFGVVMGAVVSTFVLGFGSRQQPVPQVSFEFDYDSEAGTVTITHRAGDSVPADKLYVRVGSSSRSWASLSDELGPSDMVAAGNRVTVKAGPTATVRVVYRGENTSATLGEFEGPEA